MSYTLEPPPLLVWSCMCVKTTAQVVKKKWREEPGPAPKSFRLGAQIMLTLFRSEFTWPFWKISNWTGNPVSPSTSPCGRKYKHLFLIWNMPFLPSHMLLIQIWLITVEQDILEIHLTLFNLTKGTSVYIHIWRNWHLEGASLFLFFTWIFKKYIFFMCESSLYTVEDHWCRPTHCHRPCCNLLCLCWF